MIRFAIILFLATFTQICSSQVPVWQAVDLNLKETVIEMEMDSLGFLWFLSKTEWIRFDGITTKRFLKSNEKTPFYNLQKSAQGNFIIAYENGKTIEFSPYTYESKPSLELANRSIDKVISWKKYHVIISYGSGIYLFNKNDLVDSINADSGLISDEIYDAIIDHSVLTIATDLGIQKLAIDYEHGRIKVINSAQYLNTHVCTHIVNGCSADWVSDFETNLYQIDSLGSILNTFSIGKKSKINDVLLHNKNVYIGKEEGVFRINSYGVVENIGDSKIDNVQKLLIDYHENLWLLDKNGALLRGNLMLQKIFDAEEAVQSVLQYNNAFLVGTERGLFFYIKDVKDKILNANVTSLTRDKAGRIWVGTYSEGVYVLNNQLEIISQLDAWSGTSNQSVLCLANSSYGGVFVSTLSGVYTLKLTDIGVLSIEDFDRKLPPSYSYCIYSDLSGIYFGTDRQGFNRIKRNELLHVEKTNLLEKVESVFSITASDDQQIWFSSSNFGLGKLLGEVAFKYENLIDPQDAYTSLITLPNHRLLMIRSKSIDVLDLNNGYVLPYGEILGLQEKEQYFNVFDQTDKGLILAHNNTIFQYYHAKDIPTHPSIIIDEISCNLKSQSPQKSNFKQAENNFEFRYTASWLHEPDKLQYQYMLEGLDADWRTTYDKQVAYPNLSPGEYVFKIKASASSYFKDELWSSYSFEIKKAFYNQWWFWVLLVALLIFILYQYLNWIQGQSQRITELELAKKEAELTNLKTQLNPHFLFNSFNTLLNLIEEDPAQGAKFTEALTDFYRKVLELGQQNLISLGEEIEVTKDYIKLLKERYHDKLNIDLDVHDMAYQIPPLCLQLLIENAVKHNIVSQSKPLFISITQQENVIIIKNKKARKLTKEISTGTGLKNIQKRLKLVGFEAPEINESDEYFEIKLHLNK